MTMKDSCSDANSTSSTRAWHSFFRLEAIGGIGLIGAAILAMVAANSSLGPFYEAFRAIPVQVRLGPLDIEKPLLLWINDGLMAVFFLLVALEIKREACAGQLATRANLALPLACALAGVGIPALIFVAFNGPTAEAIRGWAIPTATDIAFALGVLSLLGSRVPASLKLLLSTIAVIDDIIAIAIIALFYSAEVSVPALMYGTVAIVGMLILNRCGVRRLAPYVLLGLVVWLCMLKSGVHPTLAGVITGLLVPHAKGGRSSPSESLEHALHPWVAYGILPLFAFANGGIALHGLDLNDLFAPLPLGIMVALVVGKPVGIIGATLLIRATGLAPFPNGIDMRAMLGLGMLCGIGFTMSLFVASLAYSEPQIYNPAGLGIVVGSVISGLLGWIWLRFTLPSSEDPVINLGSPPASVPMRAG